MQPKVHGTPEKKVCEVALNTANDEPTLATDMAHVPPVASESAGTVGLPLSTSTLLLHNCATAITPQVTHGLSTTGHTSGTATPTGMPGDQGQTDPQLSILPMKNVSWDGSHLVIPPSGNHWDILSDDGSETPSDSDSDVAYDEDDKRYSAKEWEEWWRKIPTPDDRAWDWDESWFPATYWLEEWNFLPTSQVHMIEAEPDEHGDTCPCDDCHGHTLVHHAGVPMECQPPLILGDMIRH